MTDPNETKELWNAELTELVLYADNEASLYPQKKSIIANVKTKLERGVYDKSKAPALWLYWVDAAAKKYCKEFNCQVIRTFPLQVRKAAAEQIAEREYEMIKNGEYGPVQVKAKKMKLPKLVLARIRLNRGGYTSSGQYYGVGAPLFSAHNLETDEYVEFRAADRKTALELIRSMFTNPGHKSVTSTFTAGQIKAFTGK